jgi:polyisoprenoid-binding protein YceI
LDREQPTRSSVAATIQVRSIDSGIAKRDQHMLGPEFFETAKYPEITFKSSRATQTGKENGDLVGDFTMHGVTHAITLHVQFLGLGQNTAGAQVTRWRVTTEPLKRSDYHLTWGETTERISMISQQVAVSMEIEAVASR